MQEHVARMGLLYEVKANIDRITHHHGDISVRSDGHRPLMNRAKDAPVAERLQAHLAKRAMRGECDRDGSDSQPT
jgi:hypothetical protein